MTKRTNRYTDELGSPPTGPMPTAGDIFPTIMPNIPPRQTGNAVLKDGQIKVGAFTMTGTGLQVSGQTTPEDWQRVGEVLFKLEGAIQWLIGDWIVYGESRSYGDLQQIAAALGRKPETLYNYASVCRAIETSRRREVLSFGHHYEVMGFDAHIQDQALDYAAENNLSVSKFRQWIKDQTEATPAPVQISAGESDTLLYNPVAVTQEIDTLLTQNPARVSRDVAQAKLEDLDTLQQWLDDARRRLLSIASRK